jgi:formylglycine-generating enzyme required for sulfatase activity
VAATGELIRYSERERRAQVDWTKFPVSGIDVADAAAYLRWLDRTGRLPGRASVRSTSGSERRAAPTAARIPTATELSPSDANFDDTYGRNLGSMGPDPVGSYPQSQSPFGLFDGTGNVFEITVSPFDPSVSWPAAAAFFFDRVTSRLINRKVDAEFSDSSFGLRVCAVL